MNRKAVLAIFGVFIGCCSNVIFLELLVKFDPGAGNLITFTQFLFIALEGILFTSNFKIMSPHIPLKNYMILVAMFFTTSVLNNYAFDFNIPMPLHMIFRSGSLIANMIVGIIIMKKTYKFSKYLSVGMITLGVVICTLQSGRNVTDLSKNKSEISEENEFATFVQWIIGIVLLTVALLMSACMGIYQETIYKRFGKYPEEALFFTHVLPLPAFLLLGSNIWQHWLEALQSELLFTSTWPIPSSIIFLICNMVTQYVCIKSVYVLTTECASLTVTLIITLRKFVSLVFSIIFFNNAFTLAHWLGTASVFLGTIIFTEIVPQLKNSLTGSKIKAN